MKTLVIVLCYGVRPPQGYPEFVKEYLQNQNGDNVVCMPCGGFTNPEKYRGRSEAGEMERAINVSKIRFISETLSVMTLGNLEQAKLHLASLISLGEPRPERIVIFGASNREKKILKFARGLFKVFYRKQPLPLEFHGFDLKAGTKENIREFFVTILEMFDWHLSFLRRWATDKRLVNWGMAGE